MNNKGDQIKGWLLESDELDRNWKMLDEFEGEEYKRSVTDIYLEDGSIKKAYIYELA